MERHPDLFMVAEGWEEESMLNSPTKFSWNEGFTLRQLREADEAQLDLFPDCKAEPCVICAS